MDRLTNYNTKSYSSGNNYPEVHYLTILSTEADIHRAVLTTLHLCMCGVVPLYSTQQIALSSDTCRNANCKRHHSPDISTLKPHSVHRVDGLQCGDLVLEHHHRHLHRLPVLLAVPDLYITDSMDRTIESDVDKATQVVVLAEERQVTDENNGCGVLRLNCHQSLRSRSDAIATLSNFLA